MSAKAPHIPKISSQPVAVDFIDIQLPQLYPAFSHPGIEYDPVSEEYCAVPDEEIMSEETEELIPHRTTLPGVEAMKFWDLIFSDSMSRLEETFFPDPRVDRHFEYSIRSKKDWNGVRLQLMKAKNVYTSSKEGTSGKSKKMIFQRFLKGAYRAAGDNADTVKAIAHMAEDVPYISPVLTVIDTLLDVSVPDFGPRPKFNLKSMSNSRTGGHDGIKVPHESLERIRSSKDRR